jgi:uncharacterized membrane protein
MEPVMRIALLWTLFYATHIGLATAGIRGALVGRLGARAFVVLYSVVAAVVFTALVAVYADAREQGPAGISLASVPWARGPLMVAIVAGLVLMVGAFARKGYWDSPLMVLSDRVRGPVGLERVTRHPIFAGIVLVFGAHALLATRLTGMVFFAGFVALAILGPYHQARKLRAMKGAEAYDRYLAKTSAVPFAAILAGRQQLVWSELPWGMLALGILAAAGIRAVHADLFAWHGAPISATVVVGVVLILIVAFARARSR